jgi:hypothetical protein
MKLFSILVMLSTLASVFSFNANASSNALCNGCSSVQMKNKALTSSAGTKHILDLDTGVVRKYEVVIEREYGFEMRFAAEITPDPVVVSKFKIAKEAHDGIQDVKHNPNLIYPGSPYDLSGNSQAQNNFEDFIANDIGLFDLGFTYFYTILDLIPAAPDIDIILTIKFEEGGTADVVVTGMNTGITESGIDVAVISAKDSENNDIPFSKSQFNGVTNLEKEENKEGFSRAANNHGVSIQLPSGSFASGSSPSGGSGSITAVTCSTTNGEMSCSTTYIRLE